MGRIYISTKLKQIHYQTKTNSFLAHTSTPTERSPELEERKKEKGGRKKYKNLASC